MLIAKLKASGPAPPPSLCVALMGGEESGSSWILTASEQKPSGQKCTYGGEG